MTKLFTTSLMAAGLAFGGFAASSVFAGEACCSASEKVSDAAECTAKELAGACADKCGDKCTGEEAAKGGEGDKVQAGYTLGQRVPDFTLADTTGKSHSLSDFDGKVKVLVFYNQTCPYVVEVNDRLNDFAKSYGDKDVVTLAIDAGVNNSEEAIASHAANLSYPVLVDRSSKSAVNFNATRTPEIFVLDRDGVVQYHGAFDNGKAGAAEGERRSYAEDAVKAVLKGEEPLVKSTKAFGCSIKYNKSAKSSM